MAKKREEPNGKNTGLIVTLVIFILLTLLLGTLTYFGYSGQAQLETKAKDAEKARADAQQKLEEERVRSGVLAVALGIPPSDNPADLQGLWRLRSNVAQEEYQKIVQKLQGLPESDFAWPLLDQDPAPTPTNTLTDLCVKYHENMLAAQKAQQDALTAQKNAEAALNQARAQLQQEKQNFDTKVQDLQNKYNQLEAQYSNKFDTEFLARVNQEVAKNTDLQTQLKIMGDEKDKVIRGLQNQIDELSKKLSKYEAARQATTVNLNTARGSVLRKQGDVVYIDLGETHNLRPQTRFSVFPEERRSISASELRGPVRVDVTGEVTVPGASQNGNGVPPDIKGAIEVVEVLGPSISSARVVYEVDPVRNPIRPGDKLFNPAWTPGQREHIAFAGIIDLNGDGTDDSEQFIRMLEQQGVVIDAYLDLKTRTIKGKGITLDTAYLVRAAPPNLDRDFALPGAAETADPRREFKQEILQLMGQMET
ncbi:MAG TPA: hypothetical protein VIL46_05520, partial [Gemmataceae bacterium]